MHCKKQDGNNCGLQNLFSRVCRKPESTSTKSTPPSVNSIEENTTEQSVNAIQNTNYSPQCGSDYDSSDENMVARIASTSVQIVPKNTILQIGITKVGLLIDSRSKCSILSESLATGFINNSTLARWLTTVTAQELRTFANEPIPIIGRLQTPVDSNGWRIEDAEFVVVRDGLKSLIGRDLFDNLGISITQTLCSDEGGKVNTITTQFTFKTRIANQFTQLISRIGKSKVHIVKSKFHKISSLNIRRVGEYPLIYKNELILKTKNFKNFKKFNNCSDHYFASLIAITVKREQTLKKALDSKNLNKALHKNK